MNVEHRYFRSTEVECLLGDPTKARQKLGRTHRVTFDELVKEMVDEDLKIVRGQSERRVGPHE